MLRSYLKNLTKFVQLKNSINLLCCFLLLNLFTYIHSLRSLAPSPVAPRGANGTRKACNCFLKKAILLTDKKGYAKRITFHGSPGPGGVDVKYYKAMYYCLNNDGNDIIVESSMAISIKDIQDIFVGSGDRIDSTSAVVLTLVWD